MDSTMNDIDIEKSMNVALKLSLLNEYHRWNYTSHRLYSYHVEIISVCYNVNILNDHLPFGNMHRRRKVCSILRKMGIDIDAFNHTHHMSTRLMFNRIMVESRKNYRGIVHDKIPS